MVLECRVELNKKDGIIITVIDSDNKLSQEIKMDGKQLVTTVKKDSDTSTITQKPDSIAIECKKFSLIADEIKCQSKQKMDLISDGKLSLEAKDKIAVKGSQDINMQATNNLELKALAIKANADTEVKVKGTQVKVEGDMLDVKGQKVTVKGDLQTEIGGMMVTVKADTLMSVEGLSTTVKGQITSIEGTLVKLGA